jgi:agmatinase
MDHFQETLDTLSPGTIVVLGVPSDENSSSMRGPARAPALIRHKLHSGEANLSAETGIDLEAHDRWLDLGDLDLAPGMAGLEQIEQAARQLVARGHYVVTLGGDHAVTYPLVRGYHHSYSDLNILHLDAHPDLYDELDGNRYSHACPFARIMEENLATRLVQVGIRTMNPHQRQQAERFQVEVIDMLHWQPGLLPAFDGPVYLSLDLDVLDPAFAPGVSHHEPGGLSTREVIRLIQGLEASLVGADIVEYNPERDSVGMTAMTAAKLLKEIIACMIRANHLRPEPLAGDQPRAGR